MDPSFTKRGWGDLKTTHAISGLVKQKSSVKGGDLK